MIQVKKITLSAADVIAMGTVPQTILAAPASGYANTILGMSLRLNFGTVPFDAISTFRINYNAALALMTFVVSILGSTNSFVAAFEKPLATLLPFTTQEAIVIDTDAVATVGDSTVDIYIVYETKLLT